ncbi:MAG: nucleotidyltransferase family protein [Rhodospirillales bacterium]
MQMKAVIQAGGLGTRLKPYTMVLPKPLMPIGNQPVIELLLKWLRRNGTIDAYITTGYLGHLIGAVCGDGAQWDMRLKYTQETMPLGTVGALTLLRDDLDGSFLMLNGDVLTDLDLNAFGAFHRQHGGVLSIAVARRKIWHRLRHYRRTGWQSYRFPRKTLPVSHCEHGHILYEARDNPIHTTRCCFWIRRSCLLPSGQGDRYPLLYSRWIVAGYRQSRGLSRKLQDISLDDYWSSPKRNAA